MFLRDKFWQVFIITMITFAVNISPVNASSNIPLPSHTEEVKEELRMLGNSEYNFTYYTSDLGENQIKDFYRQQLSNLGWKEKKLLNELKELKAVKVDANWDKVLSQNLIFEKDTDTLTITFLPAQFSQKGKTQFTLAQGKSVLTGEAKEEADFIPALVAKPQKDVFPVYPGASLISLSEPPDAIRATYFTKDDIDVVAEFYKAKMLNYGWSLVEEQVPEKINISESGKDKLAELCPSCSENAAISPEDIETWIGQLSFSNQRGDTCAVVLSRVVPGKEMPGTFEMSTILVNYEEEKE